MKPILMMASTTTTSAASSPQRLKVEAFDTTVEPSKDKSQESKPEKSKPIRRFAPQSIETSAKSSKDRLSKSVSKDNDPQSMRNDVLVVVRPVEGSQDDQLHVVYGKNSSAAQKFALEPIETISKPHHKSTPEKDGTVTKPPHKFVPIIIDNSTRKCSRQKFAEDWENETTTCKERGKDASDGFTSNKEAASWSKRKPRRMMFVPLLIETAQRSRKVKDRVSSPYPADHVEAASEESLTSREARILGLPPDRPTNTPSVDLPQNPLFLEVQQRACSPSRRRSFFSASQHSFRVPNLDPIESSESETSNPSSPTTSLSVMSDHSFMYKEVTRRRESVDERFSGYILDLAAKEVEKQSREQALAAFPNTDEHEPVHHFVDCYVEDADSSTEGKARRGSSCSEMSGGPEAMQRCRELGAKKGKQRHELCSSRRRSLSRPAADHLNLSTEFLDASTAGQAKGEQRNAELERMRRDARPPMLGKDMRFPRCVSPEPSRFDPTQGCDAVKTTQCYLAEQVKAASEKGESLWCGKGNGRQTSKTPSLWSTANSRASSAHGLWGGMCLNGGDNSPRGPTGILTPHHERVIPLSPCPTPAMSLLPPTPPPSAYSCMADFSGIDEKLAIEQTITEDFSDDFVSQVYNYLSLGYPSLARPFDEELSKISRISINDLRQDDKLAQSRGYIRLGKYGNLADSEITEESCMRWRALRIYVQEWARQHPGMAEEEALSVRGMAERKGSWAV